MKHHKHLILIVAFSFWNNVEKNEIDQDEEDVKAIARLFADLGDSYVDLIATGNVLIPAYLSKVVVPLTFIFNYLNEILLNVKIG